jgi:hypothetical protein
MYKSCTSALPSAVLYTKTFVSRCLTNYFQLASPSTLDQPTFISDIMDSLTVYMETFCPHTIQKGWDDAIGFVFDHSSHLPLAPSSRYSYPNRRWMMRRQWYLGQDFMLLSFFPWNSPTTVWFENQLRLLSDRYKIHAAYHLNRANDPVVDDSLEEGVYEEIREAAEKAKAHCVPQMESFEVFCVANARIRQLEHEFAVTRMGLHPFHGYYSSIQTSSASHNSPRATPPLNLDMPAIVSDSPATPSSIHARLFREV